MLRVVEYKVGNCHGTMTVKTSDEETDENIIKRVELKIFQTLNVSVNSCRVVRG